MKLWPIAKITIKECLRFRVLYFIFGIALLFIIAGKGCSPGTVKGKGIFFDESALVSLAMNVAFHGIAFWSMVLCGLLAVQALPREIESGTAALTLSRPVSRSTFVAGKLLAVCAVSALNLFVLGTIFFILFYLEFGLLNFWMFAGFCVLVSGLVMFALLNICLSLLLPRLPALMIAMLVYIVGFVCSIPTYAARITLIWEPSSAVSVLHRVLPPLGDVQFIASGTLFQMPLLAKAAVPALSSCAYLVLLWYATRYLISKKQL
jgi:ABC-type transport system involved in multi-copper enzyme maturation permease subunit